MVSIVIPTYCNPSTLAETIAALGHVDYPRDRYEIVVVDDGSPVDARAQLPRLGGDAPRLRYVRVEHGGPAKARNVGARAAQGEVLLFLDDDMIVPPELIARHLRTLDHFGACLVCGYRVFGPNLTALLEQLPFGLFRFEL